MAASAGGGVRTAGAMRATAYPASGAARGIVGGTLLVAGACVPWLTLFGGLHGYRGIIGLNGRLLLAAGVLSLLAGAWLATRGARVGGGASRDAATRDAARHSSGTARAVARVRLALGVVGAASLVFACWLAVQLHAQLGALSENPMLVARAGPGLWMCAAGAALVALAPLRRPSLRVRALANATTGAP